MFIKRISKGTISKRKDGLWIGQAIISYEDNTKQRICVSSKTKFECEKKLELKKNIYRNKTEDKAEISYEKNTYVNYLLTTWLAEKMQEGLALKTISNQRYTILKHFTFFKDKSAEEITIQDLYEFQSYCIDENNLSTGTFKKFYHILNNSFSNLVRDRIISNNPVRFMRLRKGMEKERQLFTTEEINTLLEEAKQNDLINSCKCMYPFLLFALTTGCRRGEICALRWDDINVEKMTCVISKSIAVVSNKGGKPNEYISSTKNKKVRTIPINEKLLSELLKLKQYNSEFIFSDYRNRRRFISPRTISNTYRRLQKKTGINKSIHVFRHQFISNALEKGISLKAVQLVVGHASLNVTGRYWHPEAESLNEIRNLYIES